MPDDHPFSRTREDYRCEDEIGAGGFATAYRAVHGPDARVVVLKSLDEPHTDERVHRMRREIDVMRQLAGQPNLMPVLASGEDNCWYVMPEAKGSLRSCAYTLNSAPDYRDMIVDVARGLAAAHAEGFVHRDVTPGNVLLMESPKRGWVLADFGLVRRPSGETTTLLTRNVTDFGTFGFVAPELLKDAHADATPASDVFSLARVLQWALSGEQPVSGDYGVEPGPFRRAIRDALKVAPSERSTLSEFVQGVTRAADPLPEEAKSVSELAELAAAGDLAAAEQVYDLALETEDDADLYLDHVGGINGGLVEDFAGSRPDDTLAVVQNLDRHMHESFGPRDFDYLNVLVRFMVHAARGASSAQNYGLLEDLCEVLFDAEPRWDRWRQKERTQKWLDSLRGDAAATVARVLRDHSAAVEFYCSGDWKPSSNADQRIRGVLAA